MFKAFFSHLAYWDLWLLIILFQRCDGEWDALTEVGPAWGRVGMSDIYGNSTRSYNCACRLTPERMEEGEIQCPSPK
jgi:hypothetical protein